LELDCYDYIVMIIFIINYAKMIDAVM